MKKVLIVTKSTNREIHGERIYQAHQKGILTKEELKEIDLEHDQHYETLDELLAELTRLGIDYDQVLREHAWPQEKYEIVFTVGGDGTLLHASSKLKMTQKVVPIRSSTKSVGFLCSLQRGQIKKAIESLQGENSLFKSVHRIQACIQKVQGEITLTSSPALNEVLFASHHPSSTARYQIQFGDLKEFQKSSGVWVSTAAGSSAAIAASGGELLDLESSQCQFRVRELYQNGHQRRSLGGAVFDPKADLFFIENRSKQAILSIDGSSHDIDLAYGDKVTFQNAPPILIYSKK